MKKNSGSNSSTDRRINQQTRYFLHELKIYRQTQEVLGVSHSLHPTLATPLLVNIKIIDMMAGAPTQGEVFEEGQRGKEVP